MEAICSGVPEPVENNMLTYTTVCLDYFNEIVPCISMCPSRQHLASMNLSVIFSLESGWCGKDVLKSSVLAFFMSHMRKCSDCVKKDHRTVGVILKFIEGYNCPKHIKI